MIVRWNHKNTRGGIVYAAFKEAGASQWRDLALLFT